MIQDTLTPHPYAACYPLVSGPLEVALYESIRDNGLRQPIVLWRDQERGRTWIIDGRNRHRALSQLYGGVQEDQVIWRDYNSDEEVRLAVLDYNENRRQMSTAQKSVVAGKIIEARAALIESIEDEDETGDRASRCPPQVRREVADTLGIGAQTAMKGASVVQRGANNLVDALEEGQVSVEAAYTLTQLSDDELDDVISRGRDAMRDKARELKGKAKAAKEERELAGEPKVARMLISWIEYSASEEVGSEEERAFSIDVSEPDQQRAILKLLTKLELRYPDSE